MDIINKVDETIFTKDAEDLLLLFETQKHNIIRYIKKYFKENTHFIIKKAYDNKKNGSGGHNKDNYFLTNECFNLVKDNYNLKHRYLTKILGNIKNFNPLMSLENQTIGWIENAYKDVETTKRQYIIGTYKVDLYFKDYKLVIECDEFNHKDRDINYELEREEYIISKGKSIIRFDPNNENFDLSFVLREIHKFIRNYNKDEHEPKIIIVNYE